MEAQDNPRYTELQVQNISTPPYRFSVLWIHLLPLLHLGACLAIMRSNSGWWYMVYVDLPFSILWAAVAWGLADIMTVLQFWELFGGMY
jgi:hypothetical protein